MKNYIKAGAVLALGVLLAGCSSSGVKTTCSGELVDDLETSITLSAAAADQDISSIKMTINMPASFFGVEGDLDAESMEEMGLGSMLATLLGVEEDNLTITYSTDSINVEISANSADEIRSLINLADDADMTYSVVVEELEEDAGLTCS